MNNIVTAIELSPSGVRLVTGYVFQKKVYVLNSLIGSPISVDSNGYLNRKEISDSLSVLVNTCKSALNMPSLDNFIVILPPDEFQVRSGNTSSSTTNETISQKDYTNVVNMLNKQLKIENAYPIYDDPISFCVDNDTPTPKFPLGERGESLGLSADVHFISKYSAEYYLKIFQDLGITPFLKLVSPFALSSFLCSFKGPSEFFALQIEADYMYLSSSKNSRIRSARSFGYGFDRVYEQVSEILNVSKERAGELISTFGLRNDAGFPYLTDEKKSLKDISSALEKALTLLDPVAKEMDALEKDHVEPIILVGTKTKVDGLDSYLSQKWNRNIYSFSPKVLGARNDALLCCLGGIRLSDNTYMSPLKNGKIKVGEYDLSHNNLSRG